MQAVKRGWIYEPGVPTAFQLKRKELSLSFSLILH